MGPLCEHFPQVVSLSLLHIRYSSAWSVTEVICAFPCLRELSLNGVIDLARPRSMTAIRLPPNLDTVEVGYWGLDTTLEWLLSFPVRPALRAVCLQQVRRADLAIVHKFIGAFASDLESLSLYTELDPRRDIIDITPLTRLRSIQFMFTSGRGANRSQSVVQILSSMSPSKLEDVVFRPCNQFDVVEEIDSHAREWRAVDAILQSSAFSCLRNVHFQWTFLSSGFCSWSDSQRLSSQAERTSIIQHLPGCHARGILHV